MKTINIDGSKITNWESFHDTFFEKLNFPTYYGRNMDAWIDCVTEIVENNELLLFNITGIKGLKQNNPDIYEAINECSAFVNYRLFKNGDQTALALSYNEI
ncbi:barstar family protein [Marinicella meishanensis]|uniref:barstar family protein n=1 Tax=Marinicella meishanensis TaxID=2873263 RepID=UPI001CBE85FB|nr:barstar family protein [Marinicella sp. NBU2979]